MDSTGSQRAWFLFSAVQFEFLLPDLVPRSILILLAAPNPHCTIAIGLGDSSLPVALSSPAITTLEICCQLQSG